LHIFLLKKTFHPRKVSVFRVLIIWWWTNEFKKVQPKPIDLGEYKNKEN